MTTRKSNSGSTPLDTCTNLAMHVTTDSNTN